MATAEESIAQIINTSTVPITGNSKDWEPDGNWTEERMYVYELYKSQERRRRVDEFVGQNSLMQEVIRQNEITILAVSQKGVLDEPIPEQVLIRISDQVNSIKDTKLQQSSFFIAQNACDKQGFIGRLSAPSGVDKFLPWKNHCVNWDEVNGGQVIALDFTAAYNIDCGMGNFDVLLIRAKDLATLLEYLDALYGGEWGPIQSKSLLPNKL